MRILTKMENMRKWKIGHRASKFLSCSNTGGQAGIPVFVALSAFICRLIVILVLIQTGFNEFKMALGCLMSTGCEFWLLDLYLCAFASVK